jgi:hypothetical protein
MVTEDVVSEHPQVSEARLLVSIIIMSNSYYRQTDSASWLGWAIGFTLLLLALLLMYSFMPALIAQLDLAASL